MLFSLFPFWEYRLGSSQFKTHTYTHAHIHAHTHTHTRTYTHTHIHTHAHAGARTHTHKHAHTRAHTHTHTHTHTCTQHFTVLYSPVDWLLGLLNKNIPHTLKLLSKNYNKLMLCKLTSLNLSEYFTEYTSHKPKLSSRCVWNNSCFQAGSIS